MFGVHDMSTAAVPAAGGREGRPGLPLAGALDGRDAGAAAAAGAGAGARARPRQDYAPERHHQDDVLRHGGRCFPERHVGEDGGDGDVVWESTEPSCRHGCARAAARHPRLHGRDKVRSSQGASRAAVGYTDARQEPVRRRSRRGLVELGPERQCDRRVQPGLERHRGMDPAAVRCQHAHHQQQGGLYMSLT